MLDDDDRQILVARADQHDVIHQFRSFFVGHSGRRLVEQQKSGCADQRAADFDTAAIDHGQAGYRLEQTVGEPGLEHFNQRACGRVAFFELALEVAALDQVEPQALIETLVIADHDVVEDRERQTETRALEGARHAGLIDRSSGRIGHVSAVEDDAPGVRAIDAGDDVEKRGLAGTVRADQAENFVRSDGEVEPVERQHAAEVLGQTVHFKQRAHGRHPGK